MGAATPPEGTPGATPEGRSTRQKPGGRDARSRTGSTKSAPCGLYFRAAGQKKKTSQNAPFCEPVSLAKLRKTPHFAVSKQAEAVAVGKTASGQKILFWLPARRTKSFFLGPSRGFTRLCETKSWWVGRRKAA